MRLVNRATYKPELDTTPTNTKYPLSITEASQSELREIFTKVVDSYQQLAQETLGSKLLVQAKAVLVLPQLIRNPMAELQLYFIHNSKLASLIILQPENQSQNKLLEQEWVTDELELATQDMIFQVPINNLYRQLRYLELEECLVFLTAYMVKQLSTGLG